MEPNQTHTSSTNLLITEPGNEKGLSSIEAAKLLEKFGRNIIQSAKGKNPLMIATFLPAVDLVDNILKNI